MRAPQGLPEGNHLMKSLIIRWGTILLAFGLVIGWGFWQRGSKESAYRAMDAAQAESRGLRSELAAEQERRDTEKAIESGQDKAGDDASNREQEIRDEYDQRITAALAGRDRDNERLRQQWGQCATTNLSAGAAAAGEISAQDAVRRADIAAVLRDAASLQSERDEAVDRYQAVYNAQSR